MIPGSVVEVNAHTIEKRLHTPESFYNRLRALKALTRTGEVPALPLTTEHAWFRRPNGLDDFSTIPEALPSGAWGELERVLPERCFVCKGRGVIQLPESAPEACWVCKGRGWQ